MSKKVFIPSLLVLSLLLVGIVSSGSVSASDSSQFSPLVQRLVERFNLREDEVLEVVDEFRAEHWAEMESRFEDRLDRAVDDGRITEDQKKAILEKREEMRADMGMGKHGFHFGLGPM